MSSKKWTLIQYLTTATSEENWLKEEKHDQKNCQTFGWGMVAIHSIITWINSAYLWRQYEKRAIGPGMQGGHFPHPQNPRRCSWDKTEADWLIFSIRIVFKDREPIMTEREGIKCDSMLAEFDFLLSSHERNQDLKRIELRLRKMVPWLNLSSPSSSSSRNPLFIICWHDIIPLVSCFSLHLVVAGEEEEEEPEPEMSMWID